ncbi:MAG: UDP-N-acetylmuramoyl-tripeptide--D-alanyl-D-alanine ligase, partial [Oscillospiraceae bacterium]|nr:UDP-N-acetylmuramoyl-tripeptide--D-alanyl-D-alanine ligase [Oscillospiraceae bacterium]
MKELRLKEILECLDSEKKLDLDYNIYIKDISTDTREDLKNKIFIALEGENFDGHNFVDEAAKKGAVVIIINKNNN